MRIEEVMSCSPVIAVVTIHDAAHAQPLARALVAGGIPAIEITLRTPAAMAAIEAAAGVEGAVVGGGTVLSAQDLRASAEAGAVFAVSPGATPKLLEAGRGGPIPLLPGVATASELMAGLELGYSRFKFFPAEAAGGAAVLKGLAGPFPQARFCPTGGVSLDNARDYLALPNVVCVGGSWLAPEKLMAAGDWAGVEALARTAVERLRA
ncbi:MAG TPA: bifunctional 4-hydroxy-2-oxoglutarate aldolase/2-dehydro-3-deoxy-phosphogluconate aldolase [Caulobacteraceae bacterium]|nr:bifunctional 4-hydroxy-2-oxoglutarate aldolase/2-dehydro-3-deoxy-phosphogluconate aldolase [Caulobacteraceae bacterium]